ncbi:serine protease FAM111A-like [Acipenser ruthenus]|uniref:serine protease FAM111A-like n=1 Tax=Acipenser ruthenus TaxID=7906 RepID=UPI002741CA63|nr:serine protease FAM111A-like [Acipenser ruthenus]
MAGKKQTSISSFLKKRPKCSGAEVSRSQAERLDPTEQGATASPAPDIKPETEETPLCTDDGESPPSKRTRSQTKGSFTIRLPDNSLSEESFYDDETLSDVLNKNLTLDKLKSSKKRNQLLITGQRFLTGIVPLHLPCSFITNQECFKIELIAGEEGSSRGRDPNTPQRAKHIVFYIEHKGRGNRKIVKNNHVNKQGGKLCVYAFKGETVLQALHRDGRFEDVVFKKRCQLSEVDTNRNIEMHVSVDIIIIIIIYFLADALIQGDLQLLQDITLYRYHIIFKMDKRKSTLIVSNEDAPDSQQVLCNTGLSNKPTADHQVPSIATGEPQSTSTTAGDSQPPSSGNGDSQPARRARGTGKVYRLPDTEEVCMILRSQMDDLIKLKKERKKETKDNRPIRELLRQEFGKNTEIFTEIHTIRRQTELSESVCFITVPARDGTVAEGTGFHFIRNGILTCAHVLDKCMINSQYEPELITKVSVTFKYEKLIKAECEVFYVKQIVAYDRSIDYALLELDLSQEHPPLPPALIDILAVPQTSGGICIIGHPEGRVKLIDLCSIIKAENCKAKAQEHIACHSKTLDKIENERFYQALSVYSFEMLQDRRLLFYDTCFYDGSSGSPVFNAQHQPVAMQQGGYAYKLDGGGEKQKV